MSDDAKTPVPVELVGVDEELKAAITEQRHDTATAPTTTAEQQRVTAGQRNINRLWETTQTAIAIIITIGIVIICIMLVGSKRGYGTDCAWSKHD